MCYHRAWNRESIKEVFMPIISLPFTQSLLFLSSEHQALPLKR